MLTTHRRKSVIVQQMADIIQSQAAPEAENEHWWDARVKVIQEWLRANPLRIGVPDDGTIETIMQQIARGDKYVHVRVKAWNHIVAELQGIPGVCEKFATAETSPELPIEPPPGSQEHLDLPEDNNCDQSESEQTISPLPSSTNEDASQEPNVHSISPFRGKLRPSKAKTLHHESSAPPEPQLSNQESKPKPISQMSMMERQQEWLRKKAEKAAAEKLRQQQEAEKELTFQPSLIKKPIPTKPMVDTEKAPSPPKLTRLKSAGRQRKQSSSTANKATAIASKSSSRSLLDTVKAELAASTQPMHEVSTPPTTTAPLFPTPSVTDSTIAYVSKALEAINSTPIASSTSSSTASAKREDDFHLDATSTDTKGRFQLQDPTLFDLTSMYRKKDKFARCEGVALQMGRREDTHQEQLIAVIFDRDKFPTQEAAKAWYEEHKQRLLSYL